MPREIALLDALVPTLLFAFLMSVFLSWTLDSLFAHYGLYRHIWYRALSRLAAFICMFAALGLLIY
jgi:protein AaeX